MHVGKFLINQLLKAGVKEHDPVLQSFTEKHSFEDVDIPDELVSKINSYYLTPEMAKNDPTLKSHFRSEVLNGLDTRISEEMDKLGFDDATKAAINAEKNSYNKAVLFAAKRAETAPTGDDEKVKQLHDQMKELQNQLLQKDTAITEKERELLNQFESERLNWSVDSTLKGRKWANENVDEDTNSQFARMLLDKELQTKGLKLVKGEQGIELKTQDDLDYFENHNKVGFNDFVDGVLANKKLLKVADSTPPANVTPPVTVDPTVSEAAAKARAEYEAISQQ